MKKNKWISLYSRMYLLNVFVVYLSNKTKTSHELNSPTIYQKLLTQKRPQCGGSKGNHSESTILIAIRYANPELIYLYRKW